MNNGTTNESPVDDLLATLDPDLLREIAEEIEHESCYLEYSLDLRRMAREQEAAMEKVLNSNQKGMRSQ